MQVRGMQARGGPPGSYGLTIASCPGPAPPPSLRAGAVNDLNSSLAPPQTRAAPPGPKALLSARQAQTCTPAPARSTPAQIAPSPSHLGFQS